MLTRTTITAVQALVYLGVMGSSEPVPLRELAARLNASPSYLAKVFALLAKAGIVQSHKGAAGGVNLVRDPKRISLLKIVEACQGLFTVPSCADPDSVPPSAVKYTCAFHRALFELQESTRAVLDKWTLGDLIENPAPSKKLAEKVGAPCWLYCAYAAALEELQRSGKKQKGRQRQAK